MLKLTNTLSGKQESFEPADGKTVHMYACGPTVHDFAHIGNLRTFTHVDVLRRHLKSKGWSMLHVMNITDIDDKIIRRAIELGTDIRSYTEPYTRAFLEDTDRLRIERPEVLSKATDHIEEMADLVNALLKGGYAYREGDSIYFRISRFPAYGRLARLDRQELKSGARVDVDEYEKEEPRDFVLWKAPKDDKEPRWDTVIGVGRPGWHLECSAMAMKYLGETLDIHCGGIDLVFPHHENEIAQSEAATGKPFVRFWIHAEHLIVEGEKMSKSKGNFFTLRDLLEKGFDPLTIRYLLVSVPFRSQLNFTFDGLRQAARSLDRIKDFLFRLSTATLNEGSLASTASIITTCANKFESSMDDDLNTAQALGALFELIRDVNIALSEGTVGAADRQRIFDWFKIIDDRLAILPAGPQASSDDSDIENLVRHRNDARRNRDFRRSDEIRKELLDRGIVIEDTRDGTRWRRK